MGREAVVEDNAIMRGTGVIADGREITGRREGANRQVTPNDHLEDATWNGTDERRRSGGTLVNPPAEGPDVKASCSARTWQADQRGSVEMGTRPEREPQPGPQAAGAAEARESRPGRDTRS